MGLQFICPACRERWPITLDELGGTKPCAHCGQPVTLPGSPLSVGCVLGEFEICGTLGAGRNGALYQAQDLRSGTLLALRVPDDKLIGGPDQVPAFLEQLARFDSFTHPHVARILFSGRIDQTCFYAMEYLTGGSLSDRLRQGQFDEAAAVSILTQLADGLAYLHRHQFIPRDLNPSKVMFDDAGRAKWCDLVLANPLFAGQELFARWTLHGTPAYISPEQARGHGEADVRANLYSLGALAFEMLVGRPPFVKATDMDTIAAHLTEPVPDPRLLVRISPETAALVQQLLAKDPADRFPSAAELLAVLRAPREAAQPLAQPKFITLKPGPPRATVPAPPVTAPPVAKPPASRRALWELLGWAALIAAVIAIVWWQLHRSSAPAARQPVPAVAPAPVPVPPRPPPVKVGSPVAVSNRTAAGRTIQQPGYEAVVADDGCLTNLRLAGLEFLKPGVNISRGTYFHQNGALKLPAITEPAGNVIAASGDKAAVRYEFAPSNLAWQVTNKTGAPMQFFIIFDPAVNTVMNENGEVAKPAVKKNWSHTIWFRGAARLEITGGSKLWGPWAGPYQVWEASLGPKETRTIRLTIGQRTADEAAKIAQLHGNR